jgi:predicted DNA-binding transcriptional regulator YafY
VVVLLQLGRLFEIVYILLNKRLVTAKELSDHFEVSIRTIYRDIDILSDATQRKL